MNLLIKKKIANFVLRYFILILIFWTSIIGLSLSFNIQDQNAKTVDVVTKIARSNFNKDQAYRVWASSHGGVYVQPTEKTPPSPWLSHIKDRDVVTTDGKKLTLMNPAYMLREMMNDYSDLYGIKGRITGIAYLNPNNQANKEEAKIIRRFEKGEKEVSEIIGKDKDESFYLARPMIMRQACQKCHGHLGFKNGSVRGSVSISVPMLPYRDIEFKLVKGIVFTHILVWFIGAFALSLVSYRTKNNLIEKENYLQEIKISSLVFDDTIDAILITDKNGLIIRANDALSRLTGYTPEELIGNKTSIIKSDLHNKKFYENLWNAILTKGTWQGEIWNLKKTGELFVAFESISTVKDDNGGIIYMIAILHDITNQKRYEEKIENFNKELHSKVKERTQELETSITDLKQTQNKLIESEKLAGLGGLVAGVAHEINTPVGIGVTGITHFLELTKNIKEEYKSDNMSQESFEKYLNTSEELAKIISSNLTKTAQLVKSFKQISVDQTNEEKREFYFKEYLDEILLSISNITKKTNLHIEVICDKDLKIESFPGIFSQIISNFVINSINHAYNDDEKGNIIIDVSKVDNHVTMIYKDDGKGLSKENKSKIFNPFFTTNRKKGGTGLGLNIIYNIVVSNLKGHIVCNSIEGEGIEFIITFDV